MCPQIINKSMAYIIFENITEKESEHAFLEKFAVHSSSNKLFGFKNFVQFLIDLSLVGARKQGIEGESQHKKITHALERMELSAGFAKVEKLIQPSQIKPTLLVQEEYCLPTPTKSKNISHFESQFHSQNKSVDFQEYFSSQALGRHKINSGNITVMTNSPDRRPSCFFQFSEEEDNVIGKYYDELRTRFEVFCSYGETLNTVTLKSIKLSKILKEIGLLQLIQQTRLDLIISNLTRSSPTGKIEFPQFLKILC